LVVRLVSRKRLSVMKTAELHKNSFNLATDFTSAQRSLTRCWTALRSQVLVRNLPRRLTSLAKPRFVRSCRGTCRSRTVGILPPSREGKATFCLGGCPLAGRGRLLAKEKQHFVLAGVRLPGVEHVHKVGVCGT